MKRHETSITFHQKAWDHACPVFMLLSLNPIQDGRREGEQKAPSTSFPPVTSTNVGISSQNFLTFSFNPFSTLV